MLSTLDLIAKLEKGVTPTPSLENASAWWTLTERIEASLEFDPRYSKGERGAVDRLRSAISGAIADVRAGHEIWVASIRLPLGSLRASVERRTTGLDGWPLRQ